MEELIEFLEHSKPEVQSLAAEHISGLSEDATFIQFIKDDYTVLDRIIPKIENNILCANHILAALVNLSRDVGIASYLEDNALLFIILLIVNKEFPLSDWACMLLSNITKRESAINSLLALKLKHKPVLEVLIDVFCLSRSYNKNADFHFLSSVFADTCRISEGRHFFLKDNLRYLKELLPSISSPNLIRKGGAISVLKNCCFETDYHLELINESLVSILVPLAGPEELSEEEMDVMPSELQFLESTKKREPDSAIRTMLIECLILLAVSKNGREIMRKRKVYPILRDLHKVEAVESVEEQIQEIVQLLIRDESS